MRSLDLLDIAVKSSDDTLLSQIKDTLDNVVPDIRKDGVVDQAMHSWIVLITGLLNQG